MIKKIKYLAPFAIPAVAFAQFENIENIVEAIGSLVDIALPIVVGLGLLAFFWGLAKYIFSAGDLEKKEDGKRIMIWGAVAIFVMVSIFGIVEFIGNALDIDQGGSFETPTVDRLN